MSITTYSELQTAIINWHINRSNLATGRIQECIALFEAFANRKVRTRQMEASATITMSSGSGTLPTDYLSWRSVTWPGSTVTDLEHRDRPWITENYPTSPTGNPSYFTIEGSTISTMPVDSGNTSLTFKYYQKIPSLTNSATTNWLLTAYPDFYLFGSLTETNSLIRSPMGVIWKQRRDEILDEINKVQFQHRGPAQIVIKRGMTP